jgi:adenosylcobalamin-dependent ribonucleoside-triphosphate reductase
MSYLSDKFLAQYDSKEVPFGGNGLGHFVFLRTYSRWLEDKQRRETWRETAHRVVDYSMALYNGPANKQELEKEAEQMFDALFNLKVFTAGRTLWIGGTESAKRFGSANYNCSFVVFDKLSAFTDLFHLLMVGAGVGFRILFDDVLQLPSFNTHIVVAHKPYNGKVIGERREDTVIFEESSGDFGDLASVHIVIGDSKSGWVDALGAYIQTMLRNDVESIIFNYDSVRPAGEVLKTFGGRASGHQALKRMFRNIHKVIKNAPNGKLFPLHVLDIANHIGANVVVGGVRRTSEIALFDQNDDAVLNAKVGLFEDGHTNFGNDQRFMSNNSIFFETKPTRERMLDIFERIQYNGEPGFVNAPAARKRRPNFNGLNPCAEILLDDQGVCNLTEVNMFAFANGDGTYDWPGLVNAVKLATRIGLRQTNIDIDLPVWDRIQKRDRLLGVSLDGVMDFVDAVTWANAGDTIKLAGVVTEFLVPVEFADLLDKLHEVANKEAQRYAYEMRIPAPLLVTTIKPSGTISKLPGISSGVHRARAPYYVRRVRITSTDPLARVMLDAGYPIYPENNSNGPTVSEYNQMKAMEKWEVLQKASTWVIEFPMKSSTKIGVADESAVEQFQRYLLFQKKWSDHNTSITITFSPDEVKDLVDSILENWDDYIAISFLPKDTTEYPLLPEEPITQEEYEWRISELPPLSEQAITDALIALESSNQASELLDADCIGGVCPVR